MTIFRGNVRAKGKRSAVTAFDQVKLSSSENHELCATWIGLTRKIIIINLLALSLSLLPGSVQIETRIGYSPDTRRAGSVDCMLIGRS